MGITFDIQSVPPTATDIATAREQLLRDKVVLEHRDWKLFLAMIIVMVALLILALTVGRPLLEPGKSSSIIVTSLVLFTPYIVFWVFAIYGNIRQKQVDTPKKDVNNTLASLAELAPDETARIAAWNHQDAIIAAYQALAAAQGRPLVQGEADAMKHWVDAHANVPAAED
ncbi:MAG: hypothetical protein M3A44_00195 [Gammaproteobacteria bacterium]